MKNRELAISAMFIAIAVVLPMVTHSIAAGPVLLPMHIPVLIGGLVLRPRYALIVGVLSPIISNLLTNMPPTFPMLPIMIFELGVYGLVASILLNKFNVNIYVTLVCSMVIGRLVAGIVVVILVKFFEAKMPVFDVYLLNSIKTGLPGIIIQLLIIPPVAIAVRKYLNSK